MLDGVHLAQAHLGRERLVLDRERVAGGRAGAARAWQRTSASSSLIAAAAHTWVPPTVMPSMRIVGRPTPTGTDWPSLPQVPMPSSSARSLPTRLTRVSASGPLPIRRRALHRRGELPVLDQVGLARREHEVAVGDVDLPAAEVHGVEPVADRADDVVRVVLRRRA